MVIPVIIGITTTSERREKLAQCVAAVRANTSYPYFILLHEDENRDGWVAPTRFLLSQVAPASLICILNDDMIVEKDWLTILLSSYTERFPDSDGLAQGEDTVQHGRIATCPLAPAWFLLRHCRPEYKHSYADEELTIRARSLGKYLFVPTAIIRHVHWSTGASVMDSTYDISRKREENDRAVFEERKRHAFYLEKPE